MCVMIQSHEWINTLAVNVYDNACPFVISSITWAARADGTLPYWLCSKPLKTCRMQITVQYWSAVGYGILSKGALNSVTVRFMENCLNVKLSAPGRRFLVPSCETVKQLESSATLLWESDVSHCAQLFNLFLSTLIYHVPVHHAIVWVDSDQPVTQIQLTWCLCWAECHCSRCLCWADCHCSRCLCWAECHCSSCLCWAECECSRFYGSCLSSIASCLCVVLMNCAVDLCCQHVITSTDYQLWFDHSPHLLLDLAYKFWVDMLASLYLCQCGG
jgi:hypothetical protein